MRQSIPIGHNDHQPIQSWSNRQNIRKTPTIEGLSFPYLENKLAGHSDTNTVHTVVLRMAKELKWTVKVEIGTNYYQTLMANSGYRPITRELWAEKYLRRAGAGFELARRRFRVNPSGAFCTGGARWRLILLQEWKCRLGQLGMVFNLWANPQAQ